MIRLASSLRRRVTSAIAAGAMVLATVASTAMPSRAADPDDLARALAAIAALAIIANAIDDNNGGYNRPPAYRPPAYRPPAYRPPAYRPPYYGHPNQPRPPYYGNPRPPYQPTHAQKVLPDNCRVGVVKDGRRDVYYTASCLRRANVDRLPGNCAVDVRIDGRKTAAYRDNCLFNAGFRTQRG